MRTTAVVADAETYDGWFDRPWGQHAARVELATLLRASGPVDGSFVLDVGCGTGRFTQRFHARGGRVVGVDPDPAMLAVAARRVTAPLVRADGQRLPVRDAAVDVAVAVTVCEFTADPAALIAELARVTRPGGRVVIGALNRHSPWGWHNRAQFDAPPWDRARLLTPGELIEQTAPHGSVTVRHGLFAPGALPLLGWWGPPLEAVARRAVPRFGAFTVAVIDKDGAT